MRSPFVIGVFVDCLSGTDSSSVSLVISIVGAYVNVRVSGVGWIVLSPCGELAVSVVFGSFSFKLFGWVVVLPFLSIPTRFVVASFLSSLNGICILWMRI